MMETKTINLRDMPEDLVRKAKAYAALCGMSLKDFVISAIEKAMQNDLPMTGGGTHAFFGTAGRRKRQQRSEKSKRDKETASE